MSDANTLLSRAKSALLARDYILAAKIYKSLILEEPENIAYKMELGNLYVKAGKDDQALTIFKQIERADSENFDALIAISGIYRRQKKYDESVAVLERALVMCESDSKSRAKISYNLGFTYRQMGNLNDAIKCFEEVVEENPSDVLANNHLGAIYALQGNHAKAIEAYNRGLKYDINHPILQFNIAKSYAEIGETAKAQTFFEGSLRAKPGWTEAIEAYADLLLGENKITEADEVVTQALKINPDDVKMHTAKGNVYNRQSIFENAEAEYKKALDGDKGYRNALTGLAHSLEQQGKLDEAVETISRAEKLNPNDLKIIRQSAHIYLSANKTEDAYDRISRLQNEDKNDVQTLNLLGQYFICTNEAGKAEDCFAAIKKINPDYNDLYRDWGERFVQIGDSKKAEPYLHAAIQKNPKDSESMFRLGELYESQNQMGKALQFYKKSSSTDLFNHRSKAASERIIGDDSNLSSLDFNTDAAGIDFDSIFSGGKISSKSEVEGTSLPESKNTAISETVSDVESVSLVENDKSDLAEEISLAEDDSNFISEDDSEALPSESEPEKSSVNDEAFNFDDFGMDELAKTDSGANNVSEVANLLESDENALDDDKGLDFDDLIDDGAPLDEEDVSDVMTIPDGTEYLEESPKTVEVETLQATQREISTESLNMLEEQIKKAAELAEKASYAAESAWAAASQAADAAQAAEEAKKTPSEENIPDEQKADEEKLLPENSVSEEALLPSEKDLNEDEELADSDLLAADEFLREEDISETEDGDDDFLEDIPDYLQEEKTEAEEPIMEEVEKTESESPKVDDLTLRRAIDMLPSIIAAIEDRSLLYRFRSFLSMFKTLREMLDYLPPSQRHEFMTSRNRLLLDYVISKLSGKPGLFATTKALVRSGLIHENPENKASEKEGIELVKEVLADLRSLSEGLEDETLKEVLNKEADGLEQII